MIYIIPSATYDVTRTGVLASTAVPSVSVGPPVLVRGSGSGLGHSSLVGSSNLEAMSPRACRAHGINTLLGDDGLETYPFYSRPVRWLLQADETIFQPKAATARRVFDSLSRSSDRHDVLVGLRCNRCADQLVFRSLYI